MRDNQKARVYKAEEVLDAIGNHMTIEECQRQVDRITDLRGIRGRWGLRNLRVVATNGRGGRTDGYTIRLGSQARTMEYLCHEVAHCLTPWSGYESHGPEFAGVLLHVVRQVMGKDAADTLRASFKKNGVRHRLTAIPKGLSPMPAPRAQQQKRDDVERRDRCVAEIQRMIRKGWVTTSEARRAIDTV
jgi:hypothetical protein